jgi:carbon monoxide dehydrogenase subunit G
VSFTQDITSRWVVNMKIGSSFSVPEESTRVFELFLDAPTMRSCIPGCQELLRVDDTHYTGRLVNEIAHVRFDASFSVEIVGIELPHEVRAVLKGEDRRLASSLKVDSVLQVRSEGSASLVTYSMELAMWGKLGRMGESILRRKIADVERQFVDAFGRACGASDLVEPALAGAAAVPLAPGAQSGPPPTVVASPRRITTVPGSRVGHKGRVPWWQRVRAWFGSRGRRGGHR